jgi:hypothetical protein
MPPAKKFDINEALQREDVRLDLQLKTPEDDEEKKLRLHKEFLNFYVKDLAPYGLAILFVVAMGTYRFVVLIRSNSTPEEKQRAWAALSAILAGVVGVVFGKSLN